MLKSVLRQGTHVDPDTAKGFSDEIIGGKKLKKRKINRRSKKRKKSRKHKKSKKRVRKSNKKK